MNMLLRKALRKGRDTLLLALYLSACIAVLAGAFGATLALLARM